MKIEVNIEPDKIVYCLVDADNVRNSKELIQGKLTGNFSYANGKILYEVQDMNGYHYYRVDESDFVNEPDEELKRIDDFFKAFKGFSERDIDRLRAMLVTEMRQVKRLMAEVQ